LNPGVFGQVPSFFVVILLGGYSDAAGRKLALLPPLVGAAARLLLALAVVYFRLHPGYLIVASFGDGLGGGVITTLMASFAYISSVTDARSRSRRVVVVEAANGLAHVVSDVSVGYAIGALGYAWTFVALLGVILAALCYFVFVLPDVTPPVSAAENKAAAAVFFTSKHFRQLLALYATDDAAASGRHWKLRFVLLIFVTTSVVQLGRFDVQTLFMLSAPLCFTSVWIGYFSAAAEFVGYLTSLAVTHLLVDYTGDQILIVIGLLSGMGYELVFGLSRSRLMLFMGKYISVVFLFLDIFYDSQFKWSSVSI